MIRSGNVQYHDDLEPLMRDIDSVNQHPENYNQGDVDLIVESIVMSGMYRPIYIQKSSGFIIAGNHTWLACKEMGAEQIPVVELDVDDTTARRLLVADNEIARNAQPNLGELEKILTTLQETDSLIGTGYTDQRLLQLIEYNKIPLDTDTSDHRQWPTLCFQVPPQVKNAFTSMTDMAGGDRERFELLLRLAGWEG